ncbi:4-oxalocrotonate tautomerase [Hydrogenispora ethanolica]|uniref:4-oxalocrotonate tautomerase n=1 Tax=Hydrogenispora ethanolica TaxID=1082276 RepID=A0A4R1RB82_HYDET|nr:tautomerase family protein [Hydrogenispora ethanolica]TCL63034.1 4-oxalocrotonate tautomerase [Hydrogenispora ethanolica]
MPFVQLKLAKGQVTDLQRTEIAAGLTELIGTVMGREKRLTTIIIEEIPTEQWLIGGSAAKAGAVSFVNIKISKGTSNPEEMARMMRATKELMVRVLGNQEEANYFIIDELNPDAWGLDGISMTERRSRPR